MGSYGEENIIAYYHATSRHSIAARMSNYSPTLPKFTPAHISVGTCQYLLYLQTSVTQWFVVITVGGTTLFWRVRKIAESNY